MQLKDTLYIIEKKTYACVKLKKKLSTSIINAYY